MNELNVVDTGDAGAPPIVWLGSLGSSTAMWKRQIAEFGDHHRCLLIDHPGHGDSPPADGPVSIESLGDDVLATLDDLGVERTDLVGLSLGGMVGMNLAARHPDRIDRLALLCTTSYFGNDDFWTERAATVRAGGTAPIADAVVARWLTEEYAAAHPDDAAAFVATLSACDPASYAHCCDAIRLMDQREILPDVHAATLVIAGTEDPATPPIHAEVIAGLIPGARLGTVHAAHFANWEQAEAVNRHLRDHLDRGSSHD